MSASPARAAAASRPPLPPDPEALAAARCRARFPQGLAPDAEAEFRRAQAWIVRRRRTAAAGYARDLRRLEGHTIGAPCPPELRRDLLARPHDSAVAWRLIRELCRARRYLRASVSAHYNLGCLARDGRIEAVLMGEIALWREGRQAADRRPAAPRRAA